MESEEMKEVVNLLEAILKELKRIGDVADEIHNKVGYIQVSMPD